MYIATSPFVTKWWNALLIKLSDQENPSSLHDYSSNWEISTFIACSYTYMCDYILQLCHHYQLESSRWLALDLSGFILMFNLISDFSGSRVNQLLTVQYYMSVVVWIITLSTHSSTHYSKSMQRRHQILVWHYKSSGNFSSVNAM